MARVSDPAASATAIDLSRLPAPTVVEQLSFETIRAALIAQLQLVLPTFDASVESDPAVKLLEVFAWRELLIRQQFNDRARRVMLAYATGADLDQLGALVNVGRLVIDEGDVDQGIDPVFESDTDFRRRIQLAPESFSVAGPATAYVFHALRADPTIADASATSPAPGEVLVSLLSRNGDGTADADQIAAVLAAVTDREVRPLTDQVTVASAQIVPFEIEARLTLFHGPDPVVVLTSAQTRLADYLAAARKIGRDVTLSGIYAALHVEGVLRVDLESPGADIAIDGTQCAHCVGILVTVVGHGD